MSLLKPMENWSRFTYDDLFTRNLRMKLPKLYNSGQNKKKYFKTILRKTYRIQIYQDFYGKNPFLIMNDKEPSINLTSKTWNQSSNPNPNVSTYYVCSNNIFEIISRIKKKSVEMEIFRADM